MKFRTILADPAWQFKVYSEKGMDRSAENHYKCITLQEIKDLPVKHLAEKDCTLFLWVTLPFLDQGIEVLKAWGFKYKSAVVWGKYNKDGKTLAIGTGYRVRGNPEIMLIGSRGNDGCPAPSERKLALFMEKRTKHSAKPPIQYDYAEQYPGPYLELFARNTRPGWTSLGNEIDGRDLRDSLLVLYNDNEKERVS